MEDYAYKVHGWGDVNAGTTPFTDTIGQIKAPLNLIGYPVFRWLLPLLTKARYRSFWKLQFRAKQCGWSLMGEELVGWVMAWGWRPTRDPA